MQSINKYWPNLSGASFSFCTLYQATHGPSDPSWLRVFDSHGSKADLLMFLSAQETLLNPSESFSTEETSRLYVAEHWASRWVAWGDSGSCSSALLSFCLVGPQGGADSLAHFSFLSQSSCRAVQLSRSEVNLTTKHTLWSLLCTKPTISVPSWYHQLNPRLSCVANTSLTELHSHTATIERCKLQCMFIKKRSIKCLSQRKWANSKSVHLNFFSFLH